MVSSDNLSRKVKIPPLRRSLLDRRTRGFGLRFHPMKPCSARSRPSSRASPNSDRCANSSCRSRGSVPRAWCCRLRTHGREGIRLGAHELTRLFTVCATIGYMLASTSMAEHAASGESRRTGPSSWSARPNGGPPLKSSRGLPRLPQPHSGDRGRRLRSGAATRRG